MLFHFFFNICESPTFSYVFISILSFRVCEFVHLNILLSCLLDLISTQTYIVVHKIFPFALVTHLITRFLSHL